jgi:RNA polymerase sigma-70 factor, ECF subfamily
MLLAMLLALLLRAPAVADPDAAEVARARAGDEAAFETLVSRHEDALYRLARRMLGREEDAVDAVQETFLRVFRALPRFRGEARFRTWVFGITLNVCRNQLASAAQRMSRRSASLDAQDPETGKPVVREPADPAPTPERAAAGAELRQAVARALAALAPEYREAFLLREMEGLDYEELATMLRCPVGTVKSRLNRARAALRQSLVGGWR